MECLGDGVPSAPMDHRGPLHDSRGRRLERCRHCYSPTHDWGDWNATLPDDHSRCPTCWSKVAGGLALRRRPGATSGASATSAWTAAELAEDPLEQLHSTAPADRARVEAALRGYLGRPQLCVRWVDSPLGVARAFLDATGARGAGTADLDPGPWGSDPWSNRPWEPQPWSIRTFAPPAVRDAFGAVSDRLFEVSARLISRAVASAAAEAFGFGSRWDLLEALFGDAGQFDFLTQQAIALITSAGRTSVADGGYLRLLDELRRSAGVVLVLRDQVIISERPLVLRLDDRGRPHAEGGPAIAYPDGLEAWVWHGVTVPGWVITSPGRIDAGAHRRGTQRRGSARAGGALRGGAAHPRGRRPPCPRGCHGTSLGAPKPGSTPR